MSDKGEFNAVVVSTRKLGQPFHRLKLEFRDAGAGAFANFRPGQFAQLDVSNIALPSPDNIPAELHDAAGRNIILRRPFSFARITAKGDRTRAELLYCVVGPATLRMTTLCPRASAPSISARTFLSATEVSTNTALILRSTR